MDISMKNSYTHKYQLHASQNVWPSSYCETNHIYTIGSEADHCRLITDCNTTEDVNLYQVNMVTFKVALTSYKSSDL